MVEECVLALSTKFPLPSLAGRGKGEAGPLSLSPNGAKYYVALSALWGGGGVVPIGLTPYPLLCHPYGVLEFLSPEGAE